MNRVIGGLIVALAAAGPASAQSCEDLFAERNKVFRDNGYCFTTPRAIRIFGNSGCQYDDINAVPLTASERAGVAQIAREERRLGCR